jgi:hypothetical protein
MSSISSRARIAAALAAILGAALSVFLLRRDPPPARGVATTRAEPTDRTAGLPKAFVTRPVQPISPAQMARAAAPVATPRAPLPPPVERALSFDAPDCNDLALLSVAGANTENAVATVRAGDSEPEQVRVGDLLEGGEVTFIGAQPNTGAPIVLLEDEAKVTCRALGQSPVAALKRVGSASPLDFAARSTGPGDPNRVERMVLKLPPGTSAAQVDFGAAARQR